MVGTRWNQCNIWVQSSWCLRGHTGHTCAKPWSNKVTQSPHHSIKTIWSDVLMPGCWHSRFGLVVYPWFGLVMCPRPLFWSRLRYHFVILSASSGNSGMAYSHLFVTFLISPDITLSFYQLATNSGNSCMTYPYPFVTLLIPPDITLSFYQVWSLVATAVWRTLIFSSAFPRRHSHR